MTNGTLTVLPNSSTASVRDGIWFVFPLGQDIVRVWGSMVTGQERIYVNDSLVHEQRSFRLGSTHRVVVGGQDYDVVVRMKSLWKAEVECRVEQQGTVIRSFVAKGNQSTPRWRKVLPAALAIGLIVGVLEAFMDLPGWAGTLAFAGLLVFILKKDERTMAFNVEEKAS